VTPPAATVQLSPAEIEVIALAHATAARKPRAQKIISTSGRLPNDPVMKESEAARMDWYGMHAMALAAKITNDPIYGVALEDYFAAWSTVFEPQGQPIDETQFHQVVLAYESGSHYLSPPTQAMAMKMFRRMADVLFDRARIRQGTERNNWQSHRIKLATALAFSLRDPVLIAGSRGAFRQQIARNIDASGMVLDFRERDALRYVVYSLEPLLTAALIAQQHGEDWYHFEASSGASLSAALQWLAPYADGNKVHLEFQNTRIPFDRQRAAVGMPGFSGPWNPATAVTCYQIAARLDARWITRAVMLGRAPSWIELAYPSPLISAAESAMPSSAAPDLIFEH